MIKKKKILTYIVFAPFLAIIAYILFLMVWFNIPDSKSTIFERITRKTMPEHISNLIVHQYFKPTLGDGSGCISFEVPASEGDELIKGLKFQDKKKRIQDLLVDEVKCNIQSPLYYFKSGDIFNRMTIKKNKKNTKFIWHASF